MRKWIRYTKFIFWIGDILFIKFYTPQNSEVLLVPMMSSTQKACFGFSCLCCGFTNILYFYVNSWPFVSNIEDCNTTDYPLESFRRFWGVYCRVSSTQLLERICFFSKKIIFVLFNWYRKRPNNAWKETTVLICILL